MDTTRYVALLRGINVGGKNIIKMADLRTCLDAASFNNVSTYIQSGNVVFESNMANSKELEDLFKATLLTAFGYNQHVVILSKQEFIAIAKAAPKNFGTQHDVYKSDVIFLKRPLAANDALKQLSVKDGVDTAYAGKGALYFTRLTAKASSSHLSKIITLDIYKNITIRNWNTVTKIIDLLNEET